MEPAVREAKEILKQKQKPRHWCRWLVADRGKALHCWQTGKALRKSECAACLLAYLVGGLYRKPKPKKKAWRDK